MLAALLNGNKIIATDPAWDDRKEEYRAICNEHALCQICKEHITCKFGQIKQHHFAHRCNSDCPGSNDTVEHMQGKTILYDFLNSRYSNQAKMEMEPYFEDINQIGDILLEFPNGAKWAVEFACNIKKKDLQEKKDYYERHNIPVTWIIPRRLCETIDDRYVRIAHREQSFIVKTGIDKLYIDDWYEQIMVKKRRIHLPTQWDSLGSLLSLDVENNRLIIFRAIRKAGHHNIFDYGMLLQEPLEDVIITVHEKWGIILYFKKEEELKPRFEEAERMLMEFDTQFQAHEKARIEAEAKRLKQTKELSYGRQDKYNFTSWREKVDQINQKPKSSHSELFQKEKDWESGSVESVFLNQYRCIHCQQMFRSGDMVSIPNISIPEGTCRACGNKRSKK